jgi:ubiquinol-cytochrome c reductase cytochrome c subunit
MTGWMRRNPAKLRARYLLPFFVIGAAAVAGLLTSGTAARAASSQSSSTSSSGSSAYAAGSSGSGSARSAISTRDPISYHGLSSSYVAPGRALFEANCSSCHGTEALGSAVAPPLQGLGPATVDFWVATGRMPLANPTAQPLRKPPRFNRQKTLEIVAFVSSLAPTSPDFPPGIPSVNTKGADLADGNSLFVLNCAPCHTITGSGDALANGAYAPSLHRATSTQIAEAIRTGPTNMPHFGPGNITDKQLADIVAYVTGPIQKPDNRGGVGLGGIGPVAEGFIGLIIGVGGLMLVALWIGERT